ncbi:MAG: hypothetical protein AAF409_08825 [Pseudomonadota bacterium]
MKRLLMALVMAASLGGTAIGQNQGQGPVGQWYCEWTFQNTAPGQKANPVGGTFNMIVQPNGMAQGQGMQMGSAGQFPFQFQAQAQLNGTEFIMTGQQQGGLTFGPSQFTFVSKILGPNNMAYNNKNQAGQVFASACRRSG